MKTLRCRSLLAISLFAVSSSIFANEFKSVVVSAEKIIIVDKHEILRIRNFTQQGGVLRGSVTVTAEDGGTATALVATILLPSATPNPTATPIPTPTPTATPSPTPGIARPEGPSSSGLEPINSVVIAGPATVTITAGDEPAFVTYKKEADFD